MHELLVYLCNIGWARCTTSILHGRQNIILRTSVTIAVASAAVDKFSLLLEKYHGLRFQYVEYVLSTDPQHDRQDDNIRNINMINNYTLSFSVYLYPSTLSMYVLQPWIITHEKWTTLIFASTLIWAHNSCANTIYPTNYCNNPEIT